MNSDDPRITLGLLEAIEFDPAITQRSIARELRIALGLANSYLKRCVKKGLIKVHDAPARRYAYYLTPSGLAEKSRLTSEFLSQAFHFFRTSRDQISTIFAECVTTGPKRVLIHGLTEITEVAILCARENKDVTLVGVVDPATPRSSFGDVKIFRDLANLPEFDVILIADIDNAQTHRDQITMMFGRERVLTPAILRTAAAIHARNTP